MYFQLIQPTVGADFFGTNVQHEGTNYRLQLWDTSGSYRFRSLLPSYIKDSACGLFVYDLTSSHVLI